MPFSHAVKSAPSGATLLPQAVPGVLRRALARWGSGLILLACERSEAPWEFIHRNGETSSDRILGNVEAVIGKAVCVVHAMVGEAPLPDFACVAVFALQPKREAALDELHGFFNVNVR